MKLLATLSLTAALLAASLAPAQAQLLGHTPASHAPTASRTAPITLTFGQPVTGVASLRVYSAQRGRLAGTGTGDGTATLNWLPTQPLLPGEQVSVSVPAALAGSSGGRTFSFRAATAAGSGALVPLADWALPVGASALYVSTVDLNNDRHLDLVVYGPTTVYTALSNGQGGFGAWNSYSPSTNTSTPGLRLMDFNQDGLLDLLWTGSLTVYLAYGTGQGTFGAAQSVISFAATSAPQPLPARPLAVGDVNGDGLMDVVCQAVWRGQRGSMLYWVQCYLNNGQGGFTLSTSNLITPAQVAPVAPVALADTNNDDQLDWLLSGGPTGISFLGNGAGTAFTSSSLGYAMSAYVAESGDFNNDGQLDLLLPTTASDARLDAYLSGGPVSQPLLAPGRIQPGWQAADFDGDGDLDVLTLCQPTTSGTPSAVYYWANNGAGSFAAPVALASSAGSALATGDLNGDGRLDVAVLGTDAAGAPVVRVLLRQATALAAHPAAASALAVYPNPAHDLVQLPATSQPVRLRTFTGQLVRELPAGTRTLDVQGLTTGVYLLQTGPQAIRLLVE